MAFDGVAQRLRDVDLVDVLAAFARVREVPVGLKVRDDAHHRSLANSHFVGECAYEDARLHRDAHEHVRVVGEEGPARRVRGHHDRVRGYSPVRKKDDRENTFDKAW